MFHSSPLTGQGVAKRPLLLVLALIAGMELLPIQVHVRSLLKALRSMTPPYQPELTIKFPGELFITTWMEL
jgi:hypothetical protein